jgi:hypothetical protein
LIETAETVCEALEANSHRACTVNLCEEGFSRLRAFDAVFNLAETTPRL